MKKIETITLAFVALGTLFIIPGVYFFIRGFNAPIDEFPLYFCAMMICVVPGVIMWNVRIAMGNTKNNLEEG